MENYPLFTTFVVILTTITHRGKIIVPFSFAKSKGESVKTAPQMDFSQIVQSRAAQGRRFASNAHG
ncbi:hypothetical protein NE586_02360 [Gemmiger formicilis]|uniref:hypothetical protein n=1 Tax=Gemmiger formicilis TaxID=745368 RepID=UPI00210C5271|nr:hypothetical protein [Gemmiger formicilis]MCQ5078749.1 hypothetical protein [Gemmiger formicilis]MCQ5114816.1 hypothetical protein [Gemmiger formicilis]